MTYPTCPGGKCKHYTFHRGIWKRNHDTGDFYQVDGWHCHSMAARLAYPNRVNKKTGGVPLGVFVWDCRGKYFEARL